MDDTHAPELVGVFRDLGLGVWNSKNSNQSLLVDWVPQKDVGTNLCGMDTKRGDTVFSGYGSDKPFPIESHPAMT